MLSIPDFSGDLWTQGPPCFHQTLLEEQSGNCLHLTHLHECFLSADHNKNPVGMGFPK